MGLLQKKFTHWCTLQVALESLTSNRGRKKKNKEQFPIRNCRWGNEWVYSNDYYYTMRRSFSNLSSLSDTYTHNREEKKNGNRNQKDAFCISKKPNRKKGTPIWSIMATEKGNVARNNNNRTLARIERASTNEKSRY